MQRVQTSFSFNGSSQKFLLSNIRTSATGDPLGALGDLGEYVVSVKSVRMVSFPAAFLSLFVAISSSRIFDCVPCVFYSLKYQDGGCYPYVSSLNAPQ